MTNQGNPFQEAFEDYVLTGLKTYGRPIGEDQVHISLIYDDPDGSGLDDLQAANWTSLNPLFRQTTTDPRGSVYSPTLHQTIDRLVSKGRLERDLGNPLILKVVPIERMN